MWDEATYANNALDMSEGRNPLVITKFGLPDFYNTKPPLVTWVQSMAIRLIGPGEWAIRLPTIISTVALLILIFYFSFQSLNSLLIGLFGSITLVTSPGYISPHIALTGDPDATLVLFVTFYSLLWVKFLVSDNSPPLGILGITIWLGFMTKGVAVLLPMMPLVIVSLFFRKARNLLTNPSFWLFVFLTAFSSILYYVAREIYSPGYLKKVWESEILRIAKPVMSWHVKPFGFYFSNLVTERFFPYVILLPVTCATLFFTAEKKLKLITLLLLFNSAIYLLTISFISVKLEWYDSVVYPWLSLVIGITLTLVLRSFRSGYLRKKSLVTFIFSLLLVCFFAFTYYRALARVSESKEQVYSWDASKTDEFRVDGGFIKRIQMAFPTIKTYFFLKEPERDNVHYDLIRFYQRSFLTQHGTRITITDDFATLKKNDLIAVCNPQLRDSLLTHSPADTLLTYKGCALCRIVDLDALQNQ
jgi:4-amino-4-deoxy-L-arabinose transferase-like glycosyltransferase